MLLASTIRPSPTISSTSEKATRTTSMNSSGSLESSPGSRSVATKSRITSSVKPGVVRCSIDVCERGHGCRPHAGFFFEFPMRAFLPALLGPGRQARRYFVKIAVGRVPVLPNQKHVRVRVEQTAQEGQYGRRAGMPDHLELALTSVGEPNRVHTQPNDPSIVYGLAVDPSWRGHQKGNREGGWAALRMPRPQIRGTRAIAWVGATTP